MNDVLTRANEIINSLPLENLRAAGIFLDRLNDNPEAARYFLAYSDWGPIVQHDVFSSLELDAAASTQVYVDFPFCATVCTFCAFYPVAGRSEQHMATYIAALKREIELVRTAYFDLGFLADTLELGGGTPTHLPLALLEDVVTALLSHLPFSAQGERNCETTPEAVTGSEGQAKLKFLRSAGFNRLSIGAQSFSDRILRGANRSHSAHHIFEALENARLLGFDRINVDLLLGIADQTLDDFVLSVQQCIELNVEIIEIYCMRYFDTKQAVPLTKQLLKEPSRFLKDDSLLVGRVAADLMLKANGYVSPNGRTYFKDLGDRHYYSEYYFNNFKAKNVIGIGRKSHSNVYPWQYANYRSIDKYCAALEKELLPIAAGCKLDPRARLAKLLTGALQLPGPFNYESIRNQVKCANPEVLDQLIETFLHCELIRKVSEGYEKTFLGFLFIEEILKSIYDRVLTPFNVTSRFLGKIQQASAPAISTIDLDHLR